MTEIVFPFLGVAFVVLVVLPAGALIARGGLGWLDRAEVGGVLHGSGARYLLLTGSSVLPLAWFFSAGLHQAESGSTLVCSFEHGAAEFCREPGLFALLLGLGVSLIGARSASSGAGVRGARGERARLLAARVERILHERVELHALRGKIVVTSEARFALGTRGLLRPRVFLGLGFAEGLSDEMLASALGHEGEHVRSFDPLRYLILHLSLALNPLGRFLLEPHAARWRAAREAHCDREAVLRGAAPLSLADALVRAARPTGREGVALGATDTALLKLRVGMLLAFAERPPARCCAQESRSSLWAVALLLLALLLPHQTGSEALDVLHVGSERALTYLWR